MSSAVPVITYRRASHEELLNVYEEQADLLVAHSASSRARFSTAPGSSAGGSRGSLISMENPPALNYTRAPPHFSIRSRITPMRCPHARFSRRPVVPHGDAQPTHSLREIDADPRRASVAHRVEHPSCTKWLTAKASSPLTRQRRNRNRYGPPRRSPPRRSDHPRQRPGPATLRISRWRSSPNAERTCRAPLGVPLGRVQERFTREGSLSHTGRRPRS
jgi:hypothetical protein